jgi:hypothetical protein
MSNNITQEMLRALLHYDEATGALLWVSNMGRCGRIKAGSVAGSLDKTTGYMQLKINGKRYLQHRLAFFMMTSTWPTDEIDHINGNRSDNRWANLRHVSRKINAQNMRKPHSDNTLGIQGVTKVPSGKFRAELACAGRSKHIGTFNTPDEAHKAYVSRKREMHIGATL